MNIDLSLKCQLFNDDCLNILKQLPDKSIDLILTDPPYNINFKPQRGTFDKIENDSMDWESFEIFMQPIMNELFRVLKDDSIAFFFTGFSSSSAFYKYALQAGFTVKHKLIWVKNNFGIGYYIRPQHEEIWFCFKGKPPLPSKAISSVILANKVNGVDLEHSCQKPIPLLEHLLKPFSKKGDLILDPFMGSGTTGEATLKNERHFLGIEIDSNFMDIAKKNCLKWEFQERLF